MTSASSTWAGLQLEHDPMPRPDDGPVPSDVVLPPSRTTSTLATLTVRRPVRRALDVGTGCGALALLLSRLADEVIATDVNERALEFTRRNAERNGVANVHAVAGPLVEPVADRRFDLVVGNLPFVISPPGSDLTFRDGTAGERDGGRRVCERALLDAAGVLEPGGIAQFLVNWVVTDPDQPFAEPVSWAVATGCDAFVLLHSVQSPSAYVDRWIISGDDDPGEWRAHLDALGAIGVANGAVTIRETARRPTIRTARMTTSAHGDGGSQIERILDARRPTDAEVYAASAVTISAHRLGGSDRHGNRRLIADDTCGVTVAVPEPCDRIVTDLQQVEAVDAAIAAWTRREAHPRHVAQRATSATCDLVRRLVTAGLATLTPPVPHRDE